MPRTCCVLGCRSGHKGNDDKVPMFSLPRDTERREKWKRAIPRQGTDGFTFDSPHVRVCEKYFDESDIVRVDQWIIGGAVVTSQRDVPKLPRIFVASRRICQARKRPELACLDSKRVLSVVGNHHQMWIPLRLHRHCARAPLTQLLRRKTQLMKVSILTALTHTYSLHARKT